RFDVVCARDAGGGVHRRHRRRARPGRREAPLQVHQLQRRRLPTGVRPDAEYAAPRRLDRAGADGRERTRARAARGPPSRGSGLETSRMKIPIIYNARSVFQRPASTAFTAVGIGLVVAVFIGMLALANGFRAALARTGSDQNVLVLRKGADSELSSGIARDAA